MTEARGWSAVFFPEGYLGSWLGYWGSVFLWGWYYPDSVRRSSPPAFYPLPSLFVHRHAQRKIEIHICLHEVSLGIWSSCHSWSPLWYPYKRERERDYEKLAPVVNYGDWEVPRSALYKLETQESQWRSLKAWEWVDSSRGLKSDNQECWGQGINAPAHLVRQRVNSNFLCLLALFSPSDVGDGIHNGENHLHY